MGITMKKIILIIGLVVLTSKFAQTEGKNEEKVVAQIGNVKITLTEVQKEISRSGKSNSFADKLNTLTTEGKKKILDQLVREKLFSLASQDEGIKLDQDEEEQLTKLRNYLLIRKYKSEKIKQNPVTEQEMKNYYQQHNKEFIIPEKRKISHIIVKEQTRAEELLKQIKEGADFSQLARENNIDASKQRGGDLGWVSHGIMVKEFEDASFQLSKGQLSEIVKTQFGYHIIKVEDIKLPEQKKYENVSADIKKRIEDERIKQLEEELRKKYNVVVDYSILTPVQ